MKKFVFLARCWISVWHWTVFLWWRGYSFRVAHRAARGHLAQALEILLQKVKSGEWEPGIPR